MCPVDNKNHLKRFDEQYNSNGKVIMDNHPLMIMAQQKRRVRYVNDVTDNSSFVHLQLCSGSSPSSSLLGPGEAEVEELWSLRLLQPVVTLPLVPDLPHLVHLACAESGRILWKSEHYVSADAHIVIIFSCTFSQISIHARNDTSSEKDGSSWEVYEMISQICIMCLVALHVVIEFVQLARVSAVSSYGTNSSSTVQLFQAGKRYWQWSNLFDWIVYIFSFLLVFDITQETRDTGVREARTQRKK